MAGEGGCFRSAGGNILAKLGAAGQRKAGERSRRLPILTFGDELTLTRSLFQRVFQEEKPRFPPLKPKQGKLF